MNLLSQNKKLKKKGKEENNVVYCYLVFKIYICMYMYLYRYIHRRTCIYKYKIYMYTISVRITKKSLILIGSEEN